MTIDLIGGGAIFSADGFCDGGLVLARFFCSFFFLGSGIKRKELNPLFLNDKQNIW
jgi:hypothetical protein